MLGNVLGERSATPGALGIAEQRQSDYQPDSGQQKNLVLAHFVLLIRSRELLNGNTVLAAFAARGIPA
jgi:hypothetical protein